MNTLMTILRVIAIVLDVLWKIPAPFVIALVLRFKTPVDDTNPHNDQAHVQRYELPWWCSFMETKDELLPGDLSIPVVKAIYDAHGVNWTSWYWLGLRNTGSITWYLGKEAPNYLAVMTQEQMTEFGIFEKVIPLGPFKLIYGWNVYRDWYSRFTKDGFWAVPYLSLRRNN